MQRNGGFAKAAKALRKAIWVGSALVWTVAVHPALASEVLSPSFAQWVATLQQHPDDEALRARIIAAARRRAPAIPEPARRDFIRGNTAMASGLGTYGARRAIRNYENALVSAPWWGEAYRSLAKAQEAAKDYSGAIEALHRFLQTGPDKSQARQAQDHIYALEEMRDEMRDLHAHPVAPTPVASAPAEPAVVTAAQPAAVAAGAVATLPSAAMKLGTTFRDCPDCPEMVAITPGYAMGKYLVTQKQWRDVMGNNPSFFPKCGDDCPVEQVSWDDVQEFLARLNEKTGRHYRLPTEAEWQFACHGGSPTKYCGSQRYQDVAWFAGNSGGHTHPVGQKQPNALGLYDMNGNVWEWTDGCLEYDCDYRVLRGGSWIYDPGFRGTSKRIGVARSYRLNEYGFRAVRTLP